MKKTAVSSQSESSPSHYFWYHSNCVSI